MDFELLEEMFSLWQDRDVKFDCPDRFLALRSGEEIIAKFTSVEDTKGNNGAVGEITISNLRIVWQSTTRPSINICIGWMCVLQIKSRKANSKLRGQTESVYILAKVPKSQYEFIFTNIFSDTPKLFSTLLAIQRSYDTSKMYREVKLRGALLENQSLKILPLETLYNRIHGVMNLCSNQGTLGVMYITNVRVVWHSNTNESFNISIPYLHITSIKLRESKFGLALVIETHREVQYRTGGYVLGFRIDPHEKVKSVIQEIHSLYRVFKAHPIFGVEYDIESTVSTATAEEEQQQQQKTSHEDESEIIQTESKTDICAAYLAGPRKSHGPVYCKELGLAIEKLPQGLTIKNLWEVT